MKRQSKLIEQISRDPMFLELMSMLCSTEEYS